MIEIIKYVKTVLIRKFDGIILYTLEESEYTGMIFKSWHSTFCHSKSTKIVKAKQSLNNPNTIPK